jgi:hypothetical protein
MLYPGAGARDRRPHARGNGRIVSGMPHLAGVLHGRQHPGLKLVTEYHPGMSHTDVMGTTVAWGLRRLYPKQ